MRKAKIVCTLGPASDSVETITAMVRAGMNVARLNFSHGTHEDHLRRIRRVRAVSRRLGIPVAVLQDIQGPKIRIGRLAGGSIELRAGERVTLTTRPVVGRGALIPTPLQSLPRDVRRGDPVLLDDGRIRLEVESVRRVDVMCRVVVGGELRDNKGLHLPGAAVSVPTLSAKDRRDIAFGQAHGVDYVALSFVRSAQDVQRARALVHANRTPIISKIEKPQAVEALDEIAAVSDGVMIARGDLGVELPLEQVPNIQKNAVRRVNQLGGLVIVATEMLESMVTAVRPTRAEVSDVANAIIDGTDAVMLSGETATGRYPVQTVETMAKIVLEAEKRKDIRHGYPLEHSRDVSTGVAAAAVAAAQQLQIRTLVAYTESGYTARLISEFRPQADILALTPNPEIVRRMALYWGVRARLVGRLHSTDAMLRQVRRICREESICPAGAPVVVVAGVPLNQPGNTNMMTIHRV